MPALKKFSWKNKHCLIFEFQFFTFSFDASFIVSPKVMYCFYHKSNSRLQCARYVKNSKENKLKRIKEIAPFQSNVK